MERRSDDAKKERKSRVPLYTQGESKTKRRLVVVGALVARASARAGAREGAARARALQEREEKSGVCGVGVATKQEIF
jgi:hypothetical protein